MYKYLTTHMYTVQAGDILNGVAGKQGVGSMLGIDVYVRDVNLQVPPLGWIYF